MFADIGMKKTVLQIQKIHESTGRVEKYKSKFYDVPIGSAAKCGEKLSTGWRCRQDERNLKDQIVLMGYL